MKKFLLTLVAALAIQFAVAQYYYIPYPSAGKNPGGLNTDLEYPVGGGISAGWNTLMAGAPASPAWSATQTLPFSFMFNGATANDFKVCNSGVLTFSTAVTAVPSYGSIALPDASIPDKSVCILGLKPYGNNSAYSNIVTKTFGSAPNRQFWITFSAYNDPNMTITGYNFWSIVLEETSNSIFVVDQRSYGAAASKLSVGVQVNATTAVNVTGSPNLAALAGTNAAPDDNSYYQFIQGVQPTLDLSVTKVSTAAYLILSQAPFTINADFRNLGTNKVTSADINYSINGGATVTAAGSAVGINPLATQNLSSSTKWTPATIGTYTIKVWASNINGGVDGNLSNDAVTITVNVVDNYAPRVILNEVFTSSTCGPCVAGNINYKNVTDAKPQTQFTTVKYQMNYPGTGDPYYTSECGTRHSYYGINSIPRMEVDGGWNVNASSFTSALFDNFQAKPAFMEITGTSSINWRKLSVTANLKPLTDISSTSLYLFVAVCEKLTDRNIKTNGETEFEHVMKKMIPNANGTLLSGLSKNVTTTKNLTFTFPGVYTLAASGATPINLATQNSVEEFNDLEVVMWVQDIYSKEVWQSGYTTHTFLGIDKQTSSMQNIQVLPNPTNGLTKVNFGLNDDNNIQVSLIDALGKTVKTFTKHEFTSGFNSFDFDVTGMATGVYFIKFAGDNFNTTQKFIVR